MKKTLSPIELFERHMRKEPDGCWLWTGYISEKGYGRFSHRGTAWKAHRFAWNFWVGDIPEGFVLDHLCRVRACVNPQHLEPVTVAENNLRAKESLGENARATHCGRGHPFTEENTRLKTSGRACIQCQKLYNSQRKSAVARLNSISKVLPSVLEEFGFVQSQVESFMLRLSERSSDI